MDNKQPAKVTVVVRVRSPEGGLAAGVGKNIGVFPAVGGPDTIIVDRDGSEARRGNHMASGAVSGFSSTNTAFAPTGRSGTSSIGSNSTTFTFDKVFWSMCAGSEVEERRGSLGRCPAPYASQNSVFEGIGKNVVDNCLAGFNTCLFAYGQTGSGKTFTMIGVTEPPSTAPRTPLPSAAATKTAATATGAASTATAVTSAASEQKDIMRAFSSHAENISDAVMVGDECDRASSFGCATANGTGCRSGCNGNDGSLRPNPTTTMNRGLRSRDQRVVTSEASRTDGAPDTGAEPNLTASFVGMPETDVCTDLEYRRNDTSDVRGSGQAEKCDRGVIPRICDFLFERVASMTAGASASSSAAGLQEGGGVDEARGADSDRATKKRRGISTRWMFRVSFTEIYMERVRDLLDTSDRPSQNLKVREHPTKGPFVEGALSLPVTNARETERLLMDGQARRVVAETNMNEVSSRSHAIFVIAVTKVDLDLETGAEGFTTSKVNLVDLAGSENSNAAGSAGTRLKEGASINKSLLTLGRVIKALVDNSTEVRPRVTPNQSPMRPGQKVSGDEWGCDPTEATDAAFWGTDKACSGRSLKPPSPTHSSIISTPTRVGSAAAAAAAASAESGQQLRPSTDGRKGSASSRLSSPLPSPFASPRVSGSPRNSRREHSGGGGGGDGGKSPVSGGNGAGGGGRVPYRESVLTFLLKDSLGGNSHTTMVATIRPGVRFLEETMSTLRYADQAKSIVNTVKVNEDPFARTVRRLKEEITTLRRDLTSSKRQEVLALAQADGLRREIDLLQVVDATLIASMKRHDTGLVRKNLGVSISDNSVDENGRKSSSDDDVGATPQLTPSPAKTIKDARSSTDSENSLTAAQPRRQQRAQHNGWGDDIQSSDGTGSSRNSLAESNDEVGVDEQGDEPQEDTTMEVPLELHVSDNSRLQTGSSREGLASASQKVVEGIAKYENSLLDVPDGAEALGTALGATASHVGQFIQSRRPQTNATVKTSIGVPVLAKNTDSGLESLGKSGDTINIIGEDVADQKRPAVRTHLEMKAAEAALESKEDTVGDDERRVIPLSYAAVLKMGVRDEDDRNGAQFTVKVRPTASKGRADHYPVADQLSQQQETIAEEKSTHREFREVDDHASKEADDGSDYGDATDSLDSAVAAAEAAAAMATAASTAAAAASNAAAAAASTAAFAAAAAIAAESNDDDGRILNEGTERGAYSAQGSGKSITDGNGGPGAPGLPRGSNASFSRGHHVGSDVESAALRSPGVLSINKLRLRHEDQCQKAVTHRRDRTLDAIWGEPDAEEVGDNGQSKQARGGRERRLRPRSLALVDTSGFLLVRWCLSLSAPAPAPISTQLGKGGYSPRPTIGTTAGEWFRGWFVLRRGELTAYSGWGVGHSCLGQLNVNGCCVEDAPEEAPAGAPFSFRVKAIAQDDHGGVQTWTLQANTPEEKFKWVNVLRGVADRDGSFSSPCFPEEKTDATSASETRDETGSHLRERRRMMRNLHVSPRTPTRSASDSDALRSGGTGNGWRTARSPTDEELLLAEANRKRYRTRLDGNRGDKKESAGGEMGTSPKYLPRPHAGVVSTPVKRGHRIASVDKRGKLGAAGGVERAAYVGNVEEDMKFGQGCVFQ